MNNERKEIIQLNGLTILVIMAVIADFLIVGFVYRWHTHQLFAIEKKHNFAYADLLDAEHQLKKEIVELEGASSWNETAYVRTLGKNISAAQ